MRLRFMAIVALAGLIMGPALSLNNVPAHAQDTPEKKKAIRESSDLRFQEYSDGTILDTKSNLMWMKYDFWQKEKKWVNWYTANGFVQKMNNKKFAGYADWRLPKAQEAMGLYNKRRRNTDKDGDRVFFDRIFPQGAGWATWTSEEKQSKAVVVSFKDEGGKEYQDKISGTDAFVRLVRGPLP